MPLKRSSPSSQPPIDATNIQPTKKTKKTKKRTTIVLPNDTWSRIVLYVDSENLPALSCAGNTTRDAAVLRDVADGSFSLMPRTERHFVKLVNNDGHNVYFQDHFASSRRSRVSPHLKWEGVSRSSATSAR